MLGARSNGKTMQILDETVAQTKNKFPAAEKIAYICKDRKNTISALKKHPNVISKGHCLYYKYNDELILIQVIEVKLPTGYKTIKIKRINNKGDLKPYERFTEAKQD